MLWWTVPILVHAAAVLGVVDSGKELKVRNKVTVECMSGSLGNIGQMLCCL